MSFNPIKDGGKKAPTSFSHLISPKVVSSP